MISNGFIEFEYIVQKKIKNDRNQDKVKIIYLCYTNNDFLCIDNLLQYEAK